MKDIYIATEDVLSEAVVERLVLEMNQKVQIAVRIRRKGNGYLKQKLPELVKTAQVISLLLLTDLDHEECPPSLISAWGGKRNFPEGLLFRIAVREIESWLMADREGFSRYSGIPVEKVPRDPELIFDPKQILLGLARKHGSRKFKEDILRERGSGALIGLSYNLSLIRFVREFWSVDRAVKRADSLSRACRCLRDLS